MLDRSPSSAKKQLCLSPRELQVLPRITWRNSLIAADLGIEEGAVKSHIRNLKGRIGLSRQEIIVALSTIPGVMLTQPASQDAAYIDTRLAQLMPGPRQVLPYLWLADKDIAVAIGLSYGSVTMHVKDILKAVEGVSRRELTLHLAQQGRLAPQPPAEQLPAFDPDTRARIARLLGRPIE